MKEVKPTKQLRSYIGLIPAAVLFAYVYMLMAQDLTFIASYTTESVILFMLAQLVVLFAYNRRIRLVIIIGITALLYFVMMRLGEVFSVEEFDSFTTTVHYRLAFSVIVLGYISAYIILWYRWGSVVYSLFMIALGMPYIIMQDGLDSSSYLMYFSVLLLLAMAVVLFSDGVFRNVNRGQRLYRYFFYSVLALLLLAGVIVLVGQGSRLEISQIDDLQHGFSDSSLVENKNGKVSVNKSMKPGGSNTNSKQLLFLAYIDNFFEMDGAPNPLYLTSYNYSLFDTVSQEFRVDSLAPDDDIYRPDIEYIAPTFGVIDSTILKNAQSYIMRHPVKMSLYNKGLELDEFLAPYSAYSVTKLALSQEQSQEYVSAYTTMSWVSDLNSAYFIYNPYSASQTLVDFQQMRFAEMRKHNTYQSSPTFMRYYTDMPKGAKYDEISALAQELVAKSGATTIIDKVLAIRDYYLSKNVIGENLFEYTDNPGVPGVPDANLLHEFLFKTRKGYCAYYAGAGLLMLRALGLPSRLSVGFLTVDRSDKSPGWYWYYQNQAHAWVQVYFPELGWMDFDFTIGNDQAREADQADGTPPVLPTDADLSVLLTVQKITKKDTTIVGNTLSAIHKGDTLRNAPQNLKADLKYCTLLRDSTEISLEEVDINDTLLLLVDKLDNRIANLAKTEQQYLEEETLIHPERGYLIDQKETSALDPDNAEKPNRPIWQRALIVVGLVLLLIFFLPLGFYFYLYLRYKIRDDYKNKTYFNNIVMLHMLNQIGMDRGARSNLEFAQQKVDPRFGIDYADFVKKYQRVKYDNQYNPSRAEALELSEYVRHEFRKFFRKLSSREKLNLFFNPGRTINFIYKYLF